MDRVLILHLIKRNVGGPFLRSTQVALLIIKRSLGNGNLNMNIAKLGNTTLVSWGNQFV